MNGRFFTLRRVAMVLVMLVCGVLVFTGPSVSNEEPASGQGTTPVQMDEDSPGENSGANPPVVPGRQRDLVASLTIFVLAIFVGFEVITKVPPTLHTPLMSGANAISGITVVGAILVAGAGLALTSFIGMIAVILAMTNVVGGFLVTHRMLSMFKKR